MQPEIRIRPVRGQDAPELAILLNEIIQRGGTTALEELFTGDTLAAAMLTGPDVISCFIAQDPQSGEIVGFQSLLRAGGEPPQICGIATFISIGRAQKGIGARLFMATRAQAEKQGLAAIIATIRADNSSGLAYYGRMGFEDYKVHASVPLRNGTPVDRLSKRFLLASP